MVAEVSAAALAAEGSVEGASAEVGWEAVDMVTRADFVAVALALAASAAGWALADSAPAD
jgi:hypothetical protein